MNDTLLKDWLEHIYSPVINDHKNLLIRMKKMAFHLERKYYVEREQVLGSDDFVNEAFLKIQQSAPNRVLGNDEAIYSWIFVQMLGLFRNWTKKKGNKVEGEDRITERSQPHTAHLNYDSDITMDISAHLDCMKKGTKDTRHIEVWKLHSEEGLNRQQISAELGIPENTVKNWLVPLRIRAKECLQLITRYRP